MTNEEKDRLRNALNALLQRFGPQPTHPIEKSWRQRLADLDLEPMNPEIRAMITVGKNWDKGKVFVGEDGAAQAAAYNEYWDVDTGTYVDDITLERPNGKPKDWQGVLPAPA